MKYQRHCNRRPQLSKDCLNRKISGVCAGIANHYELPSWGVRIAAIVSLFTFPVVTAVAYITAAVLLPNR
ncbi:PspC domain-containing protein [Thalassotalea sediminis]|uniref:PspC domain-containing protein n=1 Tax=Thalassotalea sediminis TaxID=1759089 RepID=UPI0025725D6E|nr:PspC domain-containing protein [Thalassotalea sediminis]